ncbi:UPF0557 family protein, partial [Reticulomyxa filosa]
MTMTPYDEDDDSTKIGQNTPRESKNESTSEKRYAHVGLGSLLLEKIRFYKLDESLADLIDWMLTLSFRKRPTIVDILQHRWVCGNYHNGNSNDNDNNNIDNNSIDNAHEQITTQTLLLRDHTTFGIPDAHSKRDELKMDVDTTTTTTTTLDETVARSHNHFDLSSDHCKFY